MNPTSFIPVFWVYMIKSLQTVPTPSAYRNIYEKYNKKYNMTNDVEEDVEYYFKEKLARVFWILKEKEREIYLFIKSLRETAFNQT